MRFLLILGLTVLICAPLVLQPAHAQQQTQFDACRRSSRPCGTHRRPVSPNFGGPATRPQRSAVANRIWREWFRSGSATIDFLMQRADAAMKASSP